jgi:hypothetical protein
MTQQAAVCEPDLEREFSAGFRPSDLTYPAHAPEFLTAGTIMICTVCGRFPGGAHS